MEYVNDDNKLYIVKHIAASNKNQGEGMRGND